jgi:hypothetical protein
MSKTDNPYLFSLKYLTASFLATYCSGVVHPLDLIKTRFQSNLQLTQAMMENPPPTIWCQSTAASKMLFQ